MFFQSKKKGLWKRLWRARLTTSQENDPHQPIPPNLQFQHHPQLGYQPSHYQGTTTAGISTQYFPQITINGEDGGGQHHDHDVSSDSSPQHNCGGLTSLCTSLSPGGGGGSTNNTQNDIEYKRFRALVDKLKERQLETLWQAVEMGQQDFSTGGGSTGNNPTTNEQHLSLPTDCVLVPRNSIPDGTEPHMIACKLWKWPDLQHFSELKRIPTCPNDKDPVYACCNPTHWSRVYQPETPPPPYCLYVGGLKSDDSCKAMDDDRLAASYRPPLGSVTTDGEDKSYGWCKLAYWEQAMRIGPQIPVESPSVNIFSEQPRGDGLCLTTLAQQRRQPTSNEKEIRKVRDKIGIGITLSRESDGVWLYNRSLSPIFVHSPTLCDSDAGMLSVHRIRSGCCLRVFDPNRIRDSDPWPSVIAGAQTGPVDRYSIRISFAKGWGPRYTRQEVTACPCWLEVLLSRPGR